MIKLIHIFTDEFDTSVHLGEINKEIRRVYYASSKVPFMKGWTEQEVLHHACLMSWGVKEQLGFFGEVTEIKDAT